MGEGKRRPGLVLVSGTSDWDTAGRLVKAKGAKGNVTPEVYPNLYLPHRVPGLGSVPVVAVATGCTSCHSVAVSAKGEAWTWGRNDHGQLGHGDAMRRDKPEKVAELAGQKVAWAACGKSHTAFLTEDGKLFMCGLNKMGQCGTGSREEHVMVPREVMMDVAKVCCGSEFTLAVDRAGSLWTWGHPERGQLGLGSDGSYNASESKINIKYAPVMSPTLVPPPEGIDYTWRVVDAACGAHHVVCRDAEGHVWTWGSGDYGRLGHNKQQDELRPRQVMFFSGKNCVDDECKMTAGGDFTVITASRKMSAGGPGLIWAWGKVKRTTDAWMYPQAIFDLQGWEAKSISGGNTFALLAATIPGEGDDAAEQSTIGWGVASCGELAFGESQKSSAQPRKMDKLEGWDMLQVSAGMAHSLYLVDWNEERAHKQCPRLKLPEVAEESGDKKKPKPAKKKGAQVEAPPAKKPRGKAKA